jgi:CubicO group peptidase (beta-lactamase class C family)
MTWRTTILTWILVIVATASAEEPSQTDKLKSHITKARIAWNVPGTSVVIVNSKQVLLNYQAGEADISLHTKLVAESVFPMASCTKAFTSAAIAALVDDEKLNWDDPVRRHLPTIRFSDSRLDDMMTIRDLLSHRSGFGPHDLLWYRASWPLEDVVRRIPDLPFSGQFRSTFQYSSVPVMLAGAAVVNRYGEPWELLLQDKIIKPLGLQSATFTTTEAKKSKMLATGHERAGGNTCRVMNTWVMSEPNCAGSLHLNSKDVGTWLQFHLNNGKANGNVVVTKKELDQTKSPTTIIPMDESVKAQNPFTKQMSYALGWVVYDYHGELVVAHSGLIDGFRVMLVMVPEKDIALAILNNLHQTRMNLALANTLLDELLKKQTRDWNSHFRTIEDAESKSKEDKLKKRRADRQADVAPTCPIESYAGTYSDKIYSDATVKKLEKKLELRFSSFVMNLEHWQGDTFRCTGPDFDDELVEFVVGTGEVRNVKFRELTFNKK